MAITEPAQPNASRKPQTRQRVHKPPPTLDVPDINDDADERKRVLNVLAQRRYRERKRKAKSRHSDPTQENSSCSQGRKIESGKGRPEAAAPSTAATGPLPSFAQNQQPSPNPHSWSLDLDLQSSWTASNLESTISDLLAGPDGDLGAFDDNAVSTDKSGSVDSSTGLSRYFATTLDPSLLNGFATSPESSNTPGSSSDISFPDSYLLPVLELTLLRAFIRIAARINCTANLWELTANSDFNNNPNPDFELSLHENWRPTPSQTTIPHHPFLDLLPWPRVRDRIITILSLPDAVRPPGAQGPLAIVSLAYDLEDGAEGMRIWGGEPCDPTTWEVGQVLFERWWFIFDRPIIEQSNRWRSLRGAPALRMAAPPGSVQEIN